MTVYHKAPLPFVGQKRNFLQAFRQVLAGIPADGAGWTMIDVFGGSGLLAHTAKRCKPAARVIYNDFDGYAERLRHIPDTNRLRRILSDLLRDFPRDKHLDKSAKAAVVQTIQDFDGFKDIHCLRSWLLFSGNQAGTLDEFYRKHMYHTVRRTDYPTADGYLEGLEIARAPFQTLLPPYLAQPNTLLILDPPYVSTMQGMYANAHYFGMADFLRLMHMVRPPFVLFGSTRSELLAYLDYVKECRPEEWAAKFEGVNKISLTASVARGVAGYEDNMLWRF